MNFMGVRFRGRFWFFGFPRFGYVLFGCAGALMLAIGWRCALVSGFA